MSLNLFFNIHLIPLVPLFPPKCSFLSSHLSLISLPHPKSPANILLLAMTRFTHQIFPIRYFSHSFANSTFRLIYCVSLILSFRLHIKLAHHSLPKERPAPPTPSHPKHVLRLKKLAIPQKNKQRKINLRSAAMRETVEAP